ncbi:hypothetical protein NYO67_8960 [Aspergillus flavus]|nr:hypothetical protein NYO67_8960 [Aspergillus flavus]
MAVNAKFDDRMLLVFQEAILSLKSSLLEQLDLSVLQSLPEFQRSVQANLPRLNDGGRLIVGGEDSDLPFVGTELWTSMPAPSEGAMVSLRQRSVLPWLHLTMDLIRRTFELLEENVSRSLEEIASHQGTSTLRIPSLLRSYVIDRYLQRLKETGEAIALESYQVEYMAPFTVGKERFNLSYNNEQCNLRRMGTLPQGTRTILAAIRAYYIIASERFIDNVFRKVSVALHNQVQDEFCTCIMHELFMGHL